MMIKRYFYSLTAVLVACSCGHSHDSGREHHHHSGEEEQEMHEAHAHDHGDVSATDAHEHSDEIHLSLQQAEQFGVVVDTLRQGDFMPGLKVSGRLMPVPSQLARIASPSDGIVSLSAGVAQGMSLLKGAKVASISGRGVQGGDAVEAAKVAYDAARRELDRLTPLHKEGIVSTARYNEALQAVELAKVAMVSSSGAGSTAVAPISGTLTQLLVSQGEYVTTGQTIAIVASASTLMLQADVPVAESDMLPSVVSADFKVSGSDHVFDLADLGGHRIEASSAVVSDPSAMSGLRPIYFTFNNPGNLTPGTAVEVTLLMKPVARSVSVPRTALIEQEGYYFAFVRVHPDAYEKRMVTIGASNGSEYEIKSGLAIGDEVVVKGATIVKLAAASGRVPEGHSHNH